MGLVQRLDDSVGRFGSVSLGHLRVGDDRCLQLIAFGIGKLEGQLIADLDVAGNSAAAAAADNFQGTFECSLTCARGTCNAVSSILCHRYISVGSGNGIDHSGLDALSLGSHGDLAAIGLDVEVSAEAGGHLVD